jgi:hypothetical protein
LYLTEDSRRGLVIYVCFKRYATPLQNIIWQQMEMKRALNKQVRAEHTIALAIILASL